MRISYCGGRYALRGPVFGGLRSRDLPLHQDSDQRNAPILDCGHGEQRDPRVAPDSA